MTLTPGEDNPRPTVQAGFDAILNFRDVLETVNKFTGVNHGPQRLLYRSARPDDASFKDRDCLLNDYGIKTIIDLRSKSEHIKQAQKHDAMISSSAAVPQSNDTTARPLKITGISYCEININGSSFERSLLLRLSCKVIGLMIMGYRMEAISILGREVMEPRGLIGLGYDSLDYSGREIRLVFEVLAVSSKYPIMLHCTQGKDRTGLIVLLVLLLLGVPIEAITHDYTLSEGELLPEKESRMEEIREIGLTEKFAGTPPDWAEKMAAYIAKNYGGIAGYLASIGVEAQVQTQIRKNFLG